MADEPEEMEQVGTGLSKAGYPRGNAKFPQMTDEELAMHLLTFPGSLLELAKALKTQGVSYNYPYLRKVKTGHCRKGVKRIMDQVAGDLLKQAVTAARGSLGLVIQTLREITKDKGESSETRRRAALDIYNIAVADQANIRPVGGGAGMEGIGGVRVVVLTEVLGDALDVAAPRGEIVCDVSGSESPYSAGGPTNGHSAEGVGGHGGNGHLQSGSKEEQQ